MKISVHVKEALANLVTSKLRSFLAILGILVGTGSVVALITSSELATENALAQFKTLGTNLLSVSIDNNQSGSSGSQQQRQISLKEIPLIQESSNQIVLIAPYISTFSTIAFNGFQINGQVIGATANLAKIVKIEIIKGRFVSYLDKDSLYCVIGSTLAGDFAKKGISDPVGKQVQVGNQIFTVVGVAAPWEQNLFFFADINKGVVIPIGTSYTLSADAIISNILFRLVPNPDINTVQQDILQEMQKLLPGQNIVFRNPQQIINVMASQQSTFTWLLGSIGCIALVVGGIGVMNIMLVSVVERRREIGIRMAVGAHQSDIRRMFLIEAVILTVLGGIIGIILGVLASWILTVATGWQFTFLIIPPLLGFVVSVLVGIISGFYPAYRAAKLDPIETLRSE